MKALFGILLTVAAAVGAHGADVLLAAPRIALSGKGFPGNWTRWAAAADARCPAVRGYGAWDEQNLYLVLEVAQKEPVYAGEGRGIAFFDDGVELRVNRGRADGLLQIHGDAGGVLWIQERFRPVSAGGVRLTARCEKGKGYRLFFAVPWARLTPSAQAPTDCRIEILHKRVLRPLKFEIKRFAVKVAPSGRDGAGKTVSGIAVRADGPSERVMNFGRPGYNSAELLEMLPVVLDFHPELVIVMIGTNEVVWPKKLLTPEQSAANIRKICDTVTASGAKMILCTIPPCIEAMVGKREKMDAATTAGLNAKVRKINDSIRLIAAEKKISLADFSPLFAGDLTGQDSLIRNAANSRSQDGVHPTPDGYRKMAALVNDLIREQGLPATKIACAGDSITYGAHMEGQGSSRGDTYPARLRELLEKKQTGTR